MTSRLAVEMLPEIFEAETSTSVVHLSISIRPRSCTSISSQIDSMSSRSAFCRAIRCSTSSSGAAPLSLTSQSPYIRPLAGPSSRSHDHTAASSRDFLFWPRFFDDHESREMLGMALWKLDRADTTRRRRRKRTSSEEPASGSISEAQLQDMFEGDYGFEEVRFLPRWKLGWGGYDHKSRADTESSLVGPLRQCHTPLSRNIIVISPAQPSS